MATTVYFRSDASGDGAPSGGIHTGDNSVDLEGNARGWFPLLLSTARGNHNPTAASRTVATVNGATPGVEIDNGAAWGFNWYSLPVDQDFTLSGTITFNLWAFESNMSANAAINCILERINPQGQVVSTILQTARTTELGTTAAAVNFTGTPTSTSMQKGDRIRARVFADDAGTMATGYTVTFIMGHATSGQAGDSFITFTETFGFMSTDPTGSTLYLTDTAGPAVGSNIEKEMWTSRGGGVDTVERTTIAGWTGPFAFREPAGSFDVEWYSKPLAAFTLDGLVLLNIRARKTVAGVDCGIKAELAITNEDGSNAVVWAASNAHGSPYDSEWLGDGQGGLSSTTEVPIIWRLAGDATSVTDGQRLRLRLFVDDPAIVPMETGADVIVYYAGTSGGASGDSFIKLPQSVTEFSSVVLPPPPTIVKTAVPRSYAW